ncbi:MAG: hypothetical protein Greene041662_761 [Candidatus Peregrinibacteria bacterium Greene0416_62]|nr:MAG: hypothetical protein Greene041662_761 [Candidatus Peregrinibacteria bacterium Greene0416_62]TSD00073.1 MAG: hypothetical protein Greene101449_359 [Candidatus Peregrinibacteria bacterium Greene1014_49]
MLESHVEIFNRERHPSTAQLEAVCDLFRTTVPVFDDESTSENSETIALRKTPDDYRRLLEVKTLLLICEENEGIAGLLEWDPRDKEQVLLAYITWMLVNRNSQGQGLSTKLHRHFEQTCVPAVVEHAQKTVYQALAVHLKNPALNIYRKWGYSEEGAPQWNDGRRLFMIKAPLADENT